MKSNFLKLFAFIIASFCCTSFMVSHENSTNDNDKIDLYITTKPILKSSHGSFYATCNTESLTIDVQYYHDDVLIEIFDAAGSLVVRSTFYVDEFGSQTIDISQLQPGDYVLRIVAGSVVYEGNLYVAG